MAAEAAVEGMTFVNTVHAEVAIAVVDILDGRVRESVKRLQDLHVRAAVVMPELQAGYEALERIAEQRPRRARIRGIA